MTLKKDKSGESGQQFWSYVERTAERVKAWPEWKRGVFEQSTVSGESPKSEPGKGEKATS